MTRLTIGLMGVGEMGAGLANAFVHAGHNVISDLTKRSEASRMRALKAKIEGELSLEAVVKRSDILFSILPTQFAYEEAARVSQLLRGAKAPHFLWRLMQLRQASPLILRHFFWITKQSL